MRAGEAGLVLLIGVISIVVILAQRGAAGTPLFAADELTRFSLFLLCIVVAMIAAAASLRGRGTLALAAGVGIAGATLFLPIQLALLPQSYLDSRAPAEFLAREIEIDSDDILVSDATLFGAVNWAFQRDDVYVVSPGEIAYGLSFPESRGRQLDPAKLGDFIEGQRNGRNVVVICRVSTAAELPPEIVASAATTRRADIVVLRL